MFECYALWGTQPQGTCVSPTRGAAREGIAALRVEVNKADR